MSSSQILVIEIPEFEGNENHENFSSFKIYGIESEKPVVRINENIFEGKWFSPSTFSLFFTEKKNLSSDNFLKEKIIYEPDKKNYGKFKKLKILNKHKALKIYQSLLPKRLRLYRLPLCIKVNS